MGQSTGVRGAAAAAGTASGVTVICLYWLRVSQVLFVAPLRLMEGLCSVWDYGFVLSNAWI